MAGAWKIDRIHVETGQYVVLTYGDAARIEALARRHRGQVRVVDGRRAFVPLGDEPLKPREIAERVRGLLRSSEGGRGPPARLRFVPLVRAHPTGQTARSMHPGPGSWKIRVRIRREGALSPCAEEARPEAGDPTRGWPMGLGRTQDAWMTLDTLLDAGTLGSLSDGQLLDQFRSRRDAIGQEAFRILVERHGAMVMGVCRSLVRDPHEAEDAFQATFLVLVRRCGSIRQRETIGPWVYGVACRVARRARIRSDRRRRREVPADPDLVERDRPRPARSATDQVLQEEIRRLPESLRAPLILCCLEGQSYDLAARSLGLRESTLRGRLHRARRRLERQLRRRGVLTPAVAVMFEAGRPVLSPVASTLIESTTQLAARWSALGGLLVGAGLVPASIAALAQGVIRAMLLQTVKVCGLAMLITVGVVGTLVVAQQENPGTAARAERRVGGATILPEQEGAASPGQARGPEGGPRLIEVETKRRQILRMLDHEVKLDLANESTLSQFLKAIKQATSNVHPPGLSIYVSRTGVLKDGARDLESHLDCLDLKSGKVRELLRQGLGQLHLAYIVRDGYVMISSREEIIEERLDGLDAKFDRLLEAVERLERATKDDPAPGRRP